MRSEVLFLSAATSVTELQEMALPLSSQPKALTRDSSDCFTLHSNPN